MPKIDVEGPVSVLPVSDTGRRRAGRPDTVSPTLIPLLRNPVPAAGQSRDLALPQRSHGCQACRSPEPIFPFTIAFQPVVDLQESRIDAHEA